MSWTNLPDSDVIRKLLKDRVVATARVRGLENQIKTVEAQISVESPRNPALRQLGTNRNPITELRTQLQQAQEQLDDVAAELQFFEYHLAIWRTNSYKER